MNKISLKPVSKQDYRFLFNLLKSRDPRTNISHKSMPAYDEHVRFVDSNPYSVWYIILLGNQKVGSIYLSKQNEIGIFLKHAVHGLGIGKTAVSLLIKDNPRDRYLANINPKNKKSVEFFKKQNFKLIQHTFELTS